VTSSFLFMFMILSPCVLGGSTFLNWRRSNVNYLFLFLGGIFINIMTDALRSVQGNVLFWWVSCRSMHWWSSSKRSSMNWQLSSKGISMNWKQVSKLLIFFFKHPWIFLIIIIFQISVKNCERKTSKKKISINFLHIFALLWKKIPKIKKIITKKKALVFFLFSSVLLYWKHC
jgi:hypothetical protein